MYSEDLEQGVPPVSTVKMQTLPLSSLLMAGLDLARRGTGSGQWARAGVDRPASKPALPLRALQPEQVNLFGLFLLKNDQLCIIRVEKLRGFSRRVFLKVWSADRQQQQPALGTWEKCRLLGASTSGVGHCNLHTGGRTSAGHFACYVTSPPGKGIV